MTQCLVNRTGSKIWKLLCELFIGKDLGSITFTRLHIQQNSLMVYNTEMCTTNTAPNIPY